MLHLMMIPRGATDQIDGKFKRTAEPGSAPVSVGSWPNREAWQAQLGVSFREITLFWRKKYVNFGFSKNYCQ